MQKNTLYLVDAHAFLHRSFHALPALSLANGEEVGALYGFVKMLTGLLQKQQPEFIAVCFDSKGGSAYRNALYPQYKANRPPLDPALKPQLLKAREAVEAMGLCAVFLEGWEADDLMATLARRASARGMNTVIVSGDKDVCQLIRHDIKAWDGSSGTLRDEEYVRNRYGLAPSVFADYLALLGDASDNVPGVAGIGEKSAARLLQKYGSLDKIREAADNPEKLAADKLLQKFDRDKENAVLSRRLVSLEQDAPLEADFENFRPRGCDTPEFKAFQQHYRFKILDTLSLSVPAIEEKLFDEIPFERLCTEIKDNVLLSAENGMLSVAAGGHASVLSSVSGQTAGILLDILGNHSIKKTVFSLKNILSLLSAPEDFTPVNFFDSEAADRLLHFSSKKKSLAEIVCGTFSFVLKEPGTWNADIQGISSLEYLAEAQKKEADESGQRDLLENTEFTLLPVVYSMEKRGMAVNREKLLELSSKYSARLAELQKEADDLAEGPLNILSPKQLSFVLYNKFNPELDAGWRRQFKTRDGYSTSEEALLQIKDTNPLIPVVLEYREIAKLKSGFADPLYEASAADGRVHTVFDQLGTSTGRFSSSRPNLQNIPARSEKGQEIRECFVAPPGYVLLSADYSQIDLRVLAHLSGDRNFTESFRNGEDIHRRTAGEIFDFAPELVTPDMRRSAKAINFGIVYGQTPHGLAQELGISRAEALKYINHYFEACPGIKAWTEKTVSDAKINGYVCTFAGRRRLLPELSSPNRNIRAAGERAAGNMPVQGGSAEIIKKAMLSIARLFHGSEDVRLLLQVHDELIFEVKEEKLKDIAAVVKEYMENAWQLSVPLSAELKTGRNWREMKKIQLSEL